MSATTTMETPCRTDLERRRGQVAAQLERVGDLEQAAQQSGRRVEAARAAVTAFYGERERRRSSATDVDVHGDPLPEPGEPTEDELLAELRDAEGGLRAVPSVRPMGEGNVDVEMTLADAKVEAMLEAARDVLAELRSDLRTFVIEHLADLAAERAPRAQQVAQDAETALRVAAAATRAWEGERTWWSAVLGLAVGEGEDPVVDVPANPFEGLRAGTRVELPLPERFL